MMFIHPSLPLPAMLPLGLILHMALLRQRHSMDRGRLILCRVAKHPLVLRIYRLLRMCLFRPTLEAARV